MDNYYLNNAVYLAEEFLESTRTPYYDGEVDYGDRAEHCWNGDQTRANAYSRLRYHQMFMPRAVERMLKTAPKGADVTSWRDRRARRPGQGSRLTQPRRATPPNLRRPNWCPAPRAMPATRQRSAALNAVMAERRSTWFSVGL